MKLATRILVIFQDCLRRYLVLRQLTSEDKSTIRPIKTRNGPIAELTLIVLL